MLSAVTLERRRQCSHPVVHHVEVDGKALRHRQLAVDRGQPAPVVRVVAAAALAHIPGTALDRRGEHRRGARRLVSTGLITSSKGTGETPPGRMIVPVTRCSRWRGTAWPAGSDTSSQTTQVADDGIVADGEPTAGSSACAASGSAASRVTLHRLPSASPRIRPTTQSAARSIGAGHFRLDHHEEVLRPLTGWAQMPDH